MSGKGKSANNALQDEKGAIEVGERYTVIKSDVYSKYGSCCLFSLEEYQLRQRSSLEKAKDSAGDFVSKMRAAVSGYQAFGKKSQ